ncbi:MAG: hypothetical protein A2W23_03345 [Planctomycetes bacterium RBG_16_43_13]|nr:MAG: hypothetical protein A2W23_03345 [Planctomycetes bacterium RBG_16_43_13]
MKEIRIYFECLEQAAHLIKPIIESTPEFESGKLQLKLIKLAGNHNLYSKNIAPIIFLKEPDILITTIEDGTEYPLFQLEISTAVFTEDHELQRFDGIVASVENNCIYGKLSPVNKRSRNEHGGNVNFNYLSSYKAIYEKYKQLAFHFEWICDDKGNIVVNENYHSCPKEVKTLTIFLCHLIAFISRNNVGKQNWIENFEKDIIKAREFAVWNKGLKDFSLPDLRRLNTSRTEWKDDNKELHLKINRFGHAMDPERGMLAYYGTICRSVIPKMVFDKGNDAWYKDTPKEKAIKKFIGNTKLCSGFDFLYCFTMGSGLSTDSNFIKILDSYRESEAKKLTIDLTNYLNINFCSLSKSLRTIFKFSKEFQIIDINDNIRVKLIWGTVNCQYNFLTFPPITPLKNRAFLDEDDITYISVHNVLKQNGYKILAVSYPGAQGDRVVLVEAGTGRRQQRRYIDIISYLPKSHSSLQENKGKFSSTEIQCDIDELKKYKSDIIYKEAIANFIDCFASDAPKIIKIGVGFWANTHLKVNHIQHLDISSLDYFIYIEPDQTKWKLFSTDSSGLFKTSSGSVDLPFVYEVANKEEEHPNLLSAR